jgi:hypothetical protein
MLHLSLHAGPSSTARFNNSLGWIDIGQAQPSEPILDFKALVVTRRDEGHEVLRVPNYPRWAGSHWDLVGRVLARHLWPEDKGAAREQLLPYERGGAKAPYVRHMSAGLTWEVNLSNRSPQRVGQVDIEMKPRARGMYTARFYEDAFGDTEVSFEHRPQQLSYWRLLASAIAWRLAGEDQLPPRPFLFIPDEVDAEGQGHIRLDDLPNQQRVFFSRWLLEQGLDESVEHGLAPTSAYNLFLSALV